MFEIPEWESLLHHYKSIILITKLEKGEAMKLIFCPECYDIVKLTLEHRTCYCGDAWGYYEPDGFNATIGGGAIPLGILNDSFVRALKNRRPSGMGERFDAFVIPKRCETVKEMK